jgi:hypothetical protein
MYLVLESILFVLTEGCSWRAIELHLLLLMTSKQEEMSRE